MGASGRRFVESWASPAVVAQAYEALFDELRRSAPPTGHVGFRRHGQGVAVEEGRPSGASRPADTPEPTPLAVARRPSPSSSSVGLVIIVVSRHDSNPAPAQTITNETTTTTTPPPTVSTPASPAAPARRPGRAHRRDRPRPRRPRRRRARRSRLRPRPRRARESRHPRRRIRHPPAPAHQSHAQADAADRRSSDDRAGRDQPGRFGVTDAVLSLGYRPDAFLKAYPDDTCAGVALHYAVEPEPLDTAGAVRFAARDSGIEQHLPRRQRRRAHRPGRRRALGLPPPLRGRGHHRSHPGRRSVALRRRPDRRRRSGRGLRREAPAGEAPTNWINAGTYVLEPSVLDRIPSGRRVSIERVTFPEMVADASLYAMPFRRLLDRRRYTRHLPAGPARPHRRAPGAVRGRRGVDGVGR